jgi:hypothetical protein
MQQTLEEIWYHAEVDAKYVQLDCMVSIVFKLHSDRIIDLLLDRFADFRDPLKSTMLANSCTYLNYKTLIVP